MHKNYFDIVMAHIEENVNQPKAQIKKEIPNLIGRHSRAFDEHFQLLTGYPLEYYIKQRQLNHAAKALLTQPKRLITDIALEYQFSDHSAFSRAIKDKYGVTPNEIRKEGLWCFEERLCFNDFTDKKIDTAVAQLLRSMEVGAPWDVEYMLEIERLNDDFGFDVDACYQMADLAERLGISLQGLAEYCFKATELEETEFPEHTEMEEIMRMHNLMSACNIASEEDLEAMCAYYKCEYFDLDQLKVYQYQKNHNK